MIKLGNIFSVAPDCHAPSGHYTTLWQRHFYEGLRGVVGKLVLPMDLDFNWARNKSDGNTEGIIEQRATASQQLWEQIQNAHGRHGLDAVISYCFSSDVESDLVLQTVKLGVPWINFFCDSTHRFAEVEELAQVVSLNWFPEHAASPKYRALGVPAACLPYALNPDYLPDLSCQRPKHDVTFVGLPTANRITQLGLLRLCGQRVEIRGYAWTGQTGGPFGNAISKKQRLVNAVTKRGLTEKALRRLLWPLVRSQAKGPLSDDEFHSFMRDCQVVLGLNQGRDERGRFHSYLKFRDIEFPGYGCCYLTEHNEDVTAAFVVGEEILTFRNLWEVVSEIRQIQHRPERGLAVGLAGRQRVLSEHTWTTRLKQLAKHL